MQTIQIVSLVLAAGLIVAGCQSADTSEPADQVANLQQGPITADTIAGEAVQDSEDPTVCKKIEKTGTRLGADRVCARESEWKRQQAAQRKNLTDFKRTTRVAGS